MTERTGAYRASPPRWWAILLAADGIDLVSIKDAMGHSALATTGRYLHARPASEQAARFTRAFQPAVAASRQCDPKRPGDALCDRERDEGTDRVAGGSVGALTCCLEACR